MGSIARVGPVVLIAAAGLTSATVAGFRVKKLLSIIRGMSPINRAEILILFGFFLANIKSLPFVWHIRLVNALYQQLIGRPRSIPLPGPQVLFQPLITSSTNILLECDYNMHKSNSSYFSDLDISRANLVTCICRDGIAKLVNEKTAAESGQVGIMLGSVSCSFRREIKPYQRFEVWSRVLTWDRKWLYIVSHFVEKGKIKPRGYTLQDRDSKSWLASFSLKSLVLKGKSSRHASNETDSAPKSITTTENGSFLAPTPNKAIFASALSRYVFKRGRLTIAPERVLRGSGLIPEEPSSEDAAETTGLPIAQGASVVEAEKVSPEVLIDSSLEAKMAGTEDGVWDLKRVNEERERGLKVAQYMADLDPLLHQEFSGDDTAALGEYRDLFWA